VSHARVNRVQLADWPHGVRCAECDHLFTEGEPYHQTLQSMFEDGTPVLLIVCGDCAIRWTR
jgi:hypothetical protein